MERYQIPLILFVLLALTSSLANASCEISFNESSKIYTFECEKRLHHFQISSGTNLTRTYEKMKEVYLKNSKNKEADEKYLKELFFTHLESEFRFEYPGDEELIENLISDLGKINDEFLTGPDCLEDFEKYDLEMTPFVDLNLKDIPKETLVREFSDAKMREDGFFNLGKLQEVSINLRTDNDNFLHGGGIILANRDKNSPKVWWEGDDRGYTFGESLELKFNFEEGSVKGRQYTEGYSSLASVIKDVEVCNKGKCKTVPTIFKRDEENKRYQTFMTIDGLEIELRKNHINGDVYVKMGGSIERLTDTNKGLAQVLQTAWHKVNEERIIQYHNLDHMEDRYRMQVNSGLGIAKEKNIQNWLSVRGAIEGNTQVSTDGLKNSYVGIRAEVGIDSGTFLRPHEKQVPVLEAKMYMDAKKYGDGESAYVQAGVTLYGNVYSDRDGNIVSLFAGAEKWDTPSSRLYGGAEILERHRADLNHIVGVQFRRKF